MRIYNWQPRLIAAIEQAEREPMVFGESDCVMRTAWNAAAVLSPADPRREQILTLLERYRGSYSSLTGAYLILRQDGLTPLTLIKQFFAEIPSSEASGGDIGAVREGRHLAFGIFYGAFIHIAAPDGNGVLPRSRAIRAFRVD